MDGAYIIEVNDLVISMARTRSQKKTKFPLLHKMRMPCDGDDDVYEPTVISIGPYHHKGMATLEMERTKWESLSYILGLNHKKMMRDYLEAIAGLEQQIRSCYASEINVGSDEFTKMILLDGCFMLCTFYGTSAKRQPILNVNMSSTYERKLSMEQDVYVPSTGIDVGSSQQNDVSYTYSENGIDSMYDSKRWYTAFWTHDLVLLQNQIPFFIVVKLFEVLTGRNVPITVLLKNVSRFVEVDLLFSYPKANFKLDSSEELHHLLHLCHQYFEPNKMQVMIKSNLSTCNDGHDDEGTQSVKFLGWHRVLEYCNVGIEFKKRQLCSDNTHSLLDIAFCDGVMEVPCLTIDPNTYCLFRNLILFEETCPQFGNYMTAYVAFLSQFITMPEDVSLLTERGIIVDQLDGGTEIFDLFKKLAEGVTFDFNGEYYLKHIFHAIEMQYQMGRLRWREWIGSVGSKLLGGPHESEPNHSPRRPSPEECV